MRLTVMGQYAKGLDTTQERRQEILKSLESVKHYLWHGNVVRARDKLEDLHGILDHGGIAGESSQKLRKALDEFDTYVVVNEALIPNYGITANVGAMRRRLRRALWNRRSTRS